MASKAFSTRLLNMEFAPFVTRAGFQARAHHEFGHPAQTPIAVNAVVSVDDWRDRLSVCRDASSRRAGGRHRVRRHQRAAPNRKRRPASPSHHRHGIFDATVRHYSFTNNMSCPASPRGPPRQDCCLPAPAVCQGPEKKAATGGADGLAVSPARSRRSLPGQKNSGA